MLLTKAQLKIQAELSDPRCGLSHHNLYPEPQAEELLG